MGKRTRTTSAAQNAERSLRAGRPLSPPRSLGLRAIAKTCGLCGYFVTTPPGRLRVGMSPRVQCPKCLTRRVVTFREAHGNDEVTVSRYRNVSNRATLRLNDRTRSTAVKSGQEWTSAELEIVDRRDLTAQEVATILGRTFLAVKKRRNLLNRIA